MSKVYVAIATLIFAFVGHAARLALGWQVQLGTERDSDVRIVD